MNVYEERYANRLRDMCIQGIHSACTQLDAYEAIARVYIKLEGHLPDVGIDRPPGPDPAPDDVLARNRIMEELMSGDPDGAPVFPVSDVASDTKRARNRLEAAMQVHSALSSILDSVSQHIKRLEKFIS